MLLFLIQKHPSSNIICSSNYYFTNKLTPVRVYINYYALPEDDDKKVNFPRPNTYSKYHSGISKKFQHEVINCQFMKETRSFIPNSAAKYLFSEQNNPSE